MLIVTDADLNENDVLFGRGETIRYTIAVNLRFSVLTFLQYAPLSVSGHGISGNPGNVKFRIILQERRQEYLAIIPGRRSVIIIVFIEFLTTYKHIF